MRAWLKAGATSCPPIGWTTRYALAIVSLAVFALAGAPKARAALQPIDLSVDGGEESWHAQRSFALRWSNPPGSVAAVHYRVLNSSGQVAVLETTLDWPATAIQHLSVPPAPGVYTAEVWLEDGAGGEGMPATAKLRFDDAKPGQVEPAPAPVWIGRTAFPFTLHLGHPSGPPPLSGIHGLAASVDGLPSGSPCLATATCGPDEVELQSGNGEGSVTLADLPEGTSYLHAVAVSGSGSRSALAADTALHIDKTDPVTLLTGNPEGWSSRPLTLIATATDAASGMSASGSGPFTAIRVDGGVPAVAAGDEVSATVIASGIHAVSYYARDAAGNVADGGISNGRPNHAPATATVRIDREPPCVAFAGAQDPREPERIDASASDSLSGLDPARGSIGVRPAGSGERFVPLQAELFGSVLRARWDSEAYPPGEYEFRATVYDAAGNSASSTSKGDGSPMRLSNPLKVATTLLSSFRSRAVRYGRGVSFGGRLIAGRRAPLSGATVRVIERFDPGAVPRERESTVRTGAGGAFSVHLAPGPSRDLIAIAPPTATLRGASSKPRRLTVRSSVKMRVSSTLARVGGQPVVFRGGVVDSGVAMPAEGKVVQLQFRLPGLPWREFRTVHTDSHGHFRYAYRFADDDSRGVRFQFRAFAPAQTGWPFEPASSLPVQVLGT
ncbi:MAG TPA: hypothetical protein VGN84_01885 [Solirubrobacterales bacterium]|nr:hypothetical protein [Solirubrobacterales bacterium]